MKTLFKLFLLLIPALAWGIDKVPAALVDAEQESRYKQLIEELRCVVCQNQSLADSDADLAQNLRDEVRERVRQGDSDDAIKDFLVSRYGDFVLYNPPFKAKTLLLWGGPVALIVLALIIAAGVLRGRRVDRPTAPPLSAEEQAKLSALMDPDKKEA